MNLTNFKRFRINDTHTFVDVEACGGHSSYGLKLVAYDFANERVEIRRKDKQTAMFVLKYEDTEIPDYWKDAEIIFTTAPQPQNP
ncbi:hypothetical protein ACFYKX_11305 [Cytobacillus sp. FJAT-54145]|uniref:Uncharacterized protein n=1 Tax=Cytobacillus spartinae TaxID=3299023 RepID=A0ABW6KC71_9BACI